MRLIVAAVVLAGALLVSCRGEEFFELTGEGQLPWPHNAHQTLQWQR